jgi:hypothetical protein
MSAFVTPTKKIWTEAEIEALPDNGFIHEIVDGELVMSPKNNFEHEEVSATRRCAGLERWVLDEKPQLPGTGRFLHL